VACRTARSVPHEGLRSPQLKSERRGRLETRGTRIKVRAIASQQGPDHLGQQGRHLHVARRVALKSDARARSAERRSSQEDPIRT
jgi:hypothetical protein